MKILLGASYSTDCPDIPQVRIISERSRPFGKKTGRVCGDCTGYCGQVISERYSAPIFFDAEGKFKAFGKEHTLVKQLTEPIARYVIKKDLADKLPTEQELKTKGIEDVK